VTWLLRALAARPSHKNTAGVIVNNHVLTPSQLRVQIDALGRSFEFIHHDDLSQRCLGRRGRPYCLMTFDDGKRSHATEIAPELERLGVPAVFYLPTRFIRNQEILWFDRYAALRKAVRTLPADLDPCLVKHLPFSTLMVRIDQECARHGVSVDVDSDDIRPMTWSDARRLSQKGFTVGAHGERHAILTLEPEAVAFEEIRRSIGEVTTELQRPCVSFAFPNGNHTTRLARHARRCGAVTVMTATPRWTTARDVLWCLPRVQLFGGFSRPRIELKLAMAAGGWLRNPDGSTRGTRAQRAVASHSSV